MPAGILLLGLDLKVVDYNKQYSNIMGYPPALILIGAHAADD